MQAFNELGLTPYVFQLQAEDIQTALNLLEFRIAQFDAQGIFLNWPFSDDPNNVDGDEDVQLPPYALIGVVSQLAIDLAPAFGKTVNPATLIKAKSGFETMISIGAIPDNVAENRMAPLGSGNKPWRMWRTFVNPKPSRVIDINPEIATPEPGVSHE
jgi:hypothetical protein